VNHFLLNAKAYAALVGAVCTGLLGVYAADSTLGQILTVVSIVATAVVTWRVPNLDTSPSQPILGKAFTGGTFSAEAERERNKRR
jgi:hypothetical protein